MCVCPVYVNQTVLNSFELFTSENQDGGIWMDRTDGIEHRRPLNDSKHLTLL